MAATGPGGDRSVGAAPPRDRVLVLVEDLDAPELVDDDRRHLERSLRLRSGTSITVADGDGRWRPAVLGPEVRPDGPIRAVAARPIELVVGFAPVKGDRSELIVQKLTELGIDAIVPLATERSVVRWDGDRAVKHARRLTRVAREAAMQSRNPRLPRLEAPIPLAGFLAANPGALLADPDGDAGPAALSGAAAVAIGPEGGFSPAEREGRSTVRLPGRILRTETAAIAAAVLLVGGA